MTEKEKLFCSNYLAFHSSYDSAIKAGYSEEDARKAHLLLRRRDVQKYLSKLDDECEVLSLTKSAIRGLERLAFSSPDNILNLVKGEECACDLFCISEIKKSEKGTVEVKFCDRIRALQALYEIGRVQDETASVPFFEALKNAVPDSDDSVQY